MPRWLSRALRRIHALSARGDVRLTVKAYAEAAALGFSPADVRIIVASLRISDFGERLASDGIGDWMYVFFPEINGTLHYVKIVLRSECIVVSFHEDESSETDE